MKIERDKFYKWKGRKMRAICVDAPGSETYPVLMADVENGMTYHFTSDGRYYMGDLSYLTEWINRPEVDWSKMAAWHRWVAMGGDGVWRLYDAKPRISTTYINWESGGWNTYTTQIPPEYTPKWTGDWRESLVSRPE